MSRVGLLNVAAAATSLALSVALAIPSKNVSGSHGGQPVALAAESRIVHQDGRPGLRDAGGHFVPLGDYRRILSTSSASDSLLLALAEPDRIAAFTDYSATKSPQAYRFAGKPTFPGIADVEAALAFEPDLVLINSFGASDRTARLRELGLNVFDLGEMRGVASLLPNIEAVAILLGRPEEGARLARHFARSMAMLAADVPEASRPRGIYVSVFGDSLFGGSTGSSYHDVITAAGVRDAAAGRYTGFPRYTPEDLLELDPELVVTQTGMGRSLCAFPGLDRLRVCDPTRGRIVEIDGTLLGDPSLAMLEAAEEIFDQLRLLPTPP